jgi:uncharacterized damage-inducible protein DinB
VVGVVADARDVLVDVFTRVRERVGEVVGGLTAEQLIHRPDLGSNSIAWLIWHLTRVQDDHVAAVAGFDQVWTSAGWADRFGLALPEEDIGYGHSSDEVAAVQCADASMLSDYHEAVFEQTVGFLQGLGDADLDRVVDPRWDPPVTLSVRLVSVACDDVEHVGQAAYLRGLIERSA